MKQIFLASTLFELVCLAAGIDGGDYDRPAAPVLMGTGGLGPEDAPTSTERILLVSNNAVVMELSESFIDAPGAASLVERFDRVVDLNDALAPLHVHPSSWRPDHADLPIVESYLRRRWGLDEADEIELIIESPQVNPAIALGRVFSRATIRVHADGLMSYGPTRNQIPMTNGQRMSVLHHLPLVPGVSPRLLHEFDIVHRPLGVESFTAVVHELGEHSTDALEGEIGDVLGKSAQARPWALIVGQYLSALGLISSEEETQLHIDMIEAAAARGMEVVVFKPHPAAPPSQTGPLLDAAERLGITLRMFDLPIMAEVIIDRLSPDLIVGGFSTALITARQIYRVPALAVGTDLLLEAIAPYQNSNRIPLTIISEICDGSTPDDAPSHPRLRRLLAAVTYCMAPTLSHDLRDSATDFLTEVFDEDNESTVRFHRYFKRRRLTALALPGSTSKAFAPKRMIKRSGTLVVKAVARKQQRIMKRIQSR
ncbi:polysialyltransferase family glycosyltransferase [Brevibacterium spongiae]|uniref:Alpha-2,8-polysialyltransferase family protein n=1 Tax=Brevibacterium spongiae TaxID=2909672 RepID=A0ABY5SL05_9MICO|nr:polysialyltransferase family glycosyltransferase [Brevibacterium spongiae]UVI35217.1 alpha-2,8-polysialyltransferase family protein [Brevibacterium spongiae]